MSFDTLLTHTATILRREDTGADDEHGQRVTVEVALATVMASIQPRSGISAREVPAVHQGGPAVGDHRIYLRVTDVTTADVFYHDPAVCGAANDLPLSRYEVLGVPYAAGLGHHLEVQAKRIDSPEPPLVGS